eukprot:336847-Pelagomonas_calceolata.AAC.2
MAQFHTWPPCSQPGDVNSIRTLQKTTETNKPLVMDDADNTSFDVPCSSSATSNALAPNAKHLPPPLFLILKLGPPCCPNSSAPALIHQRCTWVIRSSSPPKP